MRATCCPSHADNIRRLRPYEFYEWWYTREFDVPKGAETGALNRRGDTLATVWVNGVQVGEAANMLIEHRFDVTAACTWRGNRTLVRLRSPLELCAPLPHDARPPAPTGAGAFSSARLP